MPAPLPSGRRRMGGRAGRAGGGASAWSTWSGRRCCSFCCCRRSRSSSPWCGRPAAAPIYGHERIGRGGRPFLCWKVRTMVPDAEARLEAILRADPVRADEWARDHKLRDDPRVTWLGRWLRLTSLDEVPQLWNVLRGEMSLVGPRPVTRPELARYGASARHYLAVRPGLTGMWQLDGRNALPYARRVAARSLLRDEAEHPARLRATLADAVRDRAADGPLASKGCEHDGAVPDPCRRPPGRATSCRRSSAAGRGRGCGRCRGATSPSSTRRSWAAPRRSSRRSRGSPPGGSPTRSWSAPRRRTSWSPTRRARPARGSRRCWSPIARDTLAAVAAAACVAERRDPGATLLVLPSDHLIPDAAAFAAAAERAAALAADGSIVVFGVQPTGPSTAYGYIERGAPHGEAHRGDALRREAGRRARRRADRPRLPVERRHVLLPRRCGPARDRAAGAGGARRGACGRWRRRARTWGRCGSGRPSPRRRRSASTIR